MTKTPHSLPTPTSSLVSLNNQPWAYEWDSSTLLSLTAVPFTLSYGMPSADFPRRVLPLTLHTMLFHLRGADLALVSPYDPTPTLLEPWTADEGRVESAAVVSPTRVALVWRSAHTVYLSAHEVTGSCRQLWRRKLPVTASMGLAACPDTVAVIVRFMEPGLVRTSVWGTLFYRAETGAFMGVDCNYGMPAGMEGPRLVDVYGRQEANQRVHERVLGMVLVDRETVVIGMDDTLEIRCAWGDSTLEKREVRLPTRMSSTSQLVWDGKGSVLYSDLKGDVYSVALTQT